MALSPDERLMAAINAEIARPHAIGEEYPSVRDLALLLHQAIPPSLGR